jgi:hypothetical protein
MVSEPLDGRSAVVGQRLDEAQLRRGNLRKVGSRPSDAWLWGDVPNAPWQLVDFPLDCAFCGEFVAKGDDEPLRLVVTSWPKPEVERLLVAHAECLDKVVVPSRQWLEEHGEEAS